MKSRGKSESAFTKLIAFPEKSTHRFRARSFELNMVTLKRRYYMKNLRNLLAALAIFALLPFANVAHAQVVVYNHGKRVRVAHAASQTWSKTRTGVTKESHRIGHATTQGWSGLKSGVRSGYSSTSSTTHRIGNATTRGWNGLKRGVSNGYSSPSTASAHSRMATRSRLTTRTRLARERVLRKRASYRARLARER